ncbi:hypothetical protein ACWDLG_34685 [Nonomuraea sp. NPDC003727]
MAGREHAAVRANAARDPEEYANLAIMAGIRMGHEHKRSAGRSFGPLTASLVRTENAMVAGDPGKAVERFGTLPRGVGKTDSSTWNRALLDAARANARIGDVARATERHGCHRGLIMVVAGTPHQR